MIFLFIFITPNTFAITYYKYEKCSPNEVLGKTYDNYYCVKKGDWLSKIAKRSETTIIYLADINNIPDPDSIYIGQKIYLEKPGVAKKITQTITAKKIEATDDDFIYYTIKEGDYLLKIYNTETVKLEESQRLPYSEFVQINREKGYLGPTKEDWDLIYPDKKLIIGKKTIPAVEDKTPPPEFIYGEESSINEVLTPDFKNKILSKLREFHSKEGNIIALTITDYDDLSEQEEYKDKNYEETIIEDAGGIFHDPTSKLDTSGDPQYNTLVYFVADENDFLYYGQEEGLAEEDIFPKYIDVDKHQEKKEEAASKEIQDTSALLEFAIDELIAATLIKKQNDLASKKAEGEALLTVTSQPPRASVFIDFKDVDIEDLEFKTPIEKRPIEKAGKVEIKITHEDYEPVIEKINLEKGKENVVNVDLKTTKLEPIDVLLVTTTNLQTDSEFESALQAYRNTIRKEGLESEFVVLDSEEAMDKYRYAIFKTEENKITGTAVSGCTEWYTVKSGDTLSKIAPDRWEEVARINDIRPPYYTIYSDQKICLRTSGTSTQSYSTEHNQEKIKDTIRTIYEKYKKDAGKGFEYLILLGGDDIIPVYFFEKDECELPNCEPDNIDKPMGYKHTYKNSYDGKLLSDDDYGDISDKRLILARMPTMKGDYSSKLVTTILRINTEHRGVTIMNEPTIITDSCGGKTPLTDCWVRNDIDIGISNLNRKSCESYEICFIAPPVCPYGPRCDSSQFYNSVNYAKNLIIASHGRYPWVTLLGKPATGKQILLLRNTDYSSINLKNHPFVFVSACHSGALEITDEQCKEISNRYRPGTNKKFGETHGYECHRHIENFFNAGARAYIGSSRLSTEGETSQIMFSFFTGKIPPTLMIQPEDYLFTPEEYGEIHTIGEVTKRIKSYFRYSTIASKFMVFYGDPTQKIKFMEEPSAVEELQKILLPEGLEVAGTNPSALGASVYNFYRFVYSDWFDTGNPTSTTEELPEKTSDELQRGIELRKELETKYDSYFANSGLTKTSRDEWHPVLDGKEDFSTDSFKSTGHEALDIFADEGSPIYSPVNGIVIAQGDTWSGSCCDADNNVYNWNSKGLTPKAGNAVVIYNPTEKGYFWISHLQENVAVKTGDIVEKGQAIGRVGHSGSASKPGHGNHIHLAYKIEYNDENYLEFANHNRLGGTGTLRGINPYDYLLLAKNDYCRIAVC